LRKLSVILCALTLSATSPVLAAAEEDNSELSYIKADPEYVACIEKANGVTVEMRDCNFEFMNRLDAKLNIVWKEVLSFVGGTKTSVGSALLNGQRNWINFKESGCDYHYAANVTLNLIVGDDCKLALLQDRIGALEAILENEELRYQPD
jgi:uncharacterized protein YecT (DUF1311 family)